MAPRKKLWMAASNDHQDSIIPVIRMSDVHILVFKSSWGINYPVFIIEKSKGVASSRFKRARCYVRVGDVQPQNWPRQPQIPLHVSVLALALSTHLV